MLDGLKRVSECLQMKSLKSKLAVLLDKSGNDDKLIEALRAELSSARAGSNVKAVDVVSKEELLKQIGALQQVSQSVGPDSCDRVCQSTPIHQMLLADKGEHV